MGKPVYYRSIFIFKIVFGVWQNTKIIFHARRFRCNNPNCSAKTFSENPCDEIQRYKRNTLRLRQKLISISAGVSSLQAEKLVERYEQKISDTTILRYLHQVQVPAREEIQKIGIDDWALRRCVLYGTIIIDLETSCFVGLLNGREKEPLLEWLDKHPLVNMVSRDRASAFSAAVEEASPFITQIADRFHLVKNMSDCLVKILQGMQLDYQRVIRKMRLNDYLEQHPNSPLRDDIDLYRDHVLYEFFVNRKPLAQIHQLLQKQGMSFSLRDFCDKYRHLRGWKNKVRIVDNPKVPPAILPLYSPPVLAKLIEQHIRGKSISESAERIIKKLSQCQWFSELYNAVKGFFSFIRERNPLALKEWIEQNLNSSLSDLRILARGLARDVDAVNNALKYEFSNGIVEGYVNKLKALKRTMYGRASVKLLEIKMYLTEKHCTKFE